ncbi:hypothetical protein JCM18899A_31500 [Nocardioides sp. AN3]
MYIHIDVTRIPPTVELRAPDDFSDFRVDVVSSSHVWVDPSVLQVLAARDSDAQWQERLTAMAAFAESRGWTDDQGRIRAHVAR